MQATTPTTPTTVFRQFSFYNPLPLFFLSPLLWRGKGEAVLFVFRLLFPGICKFWNSGLQRFFIGILKLEASPNPSEGGELWPFYDHSLSASLLHSLCDPPTGGSYFRLIKPDIYFSIHPIPRSISFPPVGEREGGSFLLCDPPTGGSYFRH